VLTRSNRVLRCHGIAWIDVPVTVFSTLSDSSAPVRLLQSYFVPPTSAEYSATGLSGLGKSEVVTAPLRLLITALVVGLPLGLKAAVIALGAGSYATELPTGARRPPPPIPGPGLTAGRVPTSDWWSSLVAATNSLPMFPHPLAVQFEAAGLRICYPGEDIHANRQAIFGSMAPAGNDFVIGHSAVQNFPRPDVDEFSDWFVALRFATNQRSLRLSFGHGSPYVYGLVEGGAPMIRFSTPPLIWSGDSNDSGLGVRIGNRNYGLFGPIGAHWTGLGTTSLTCDSGGKSYFSVAVLPDASAETLALFKRFAHSHVIKTRIGWRFDPQASVVETEYRFATTNYEASAEAGTLSALYPHQWRNATTPVLPQSYQSVRGPMKLAHGESFTTRMVFPGVLPALPSVATNFGNFDFPQLLAREFENLGGEIRDTYWEGKRLGRIVMLIPIADQTPSAQGGASALAWIRKQLETWLSAEKPGGEPKNKGLFYYDSRWGTLIGCPASYGSDNELNDHHFHYGYFIRAAAEIAIRDPAWGSGSSWGGMVNLLIRDIASGHRADPMFPFLRCFDPYAGHSWASGFARFADGNNQESSSEAMNAWYGMILWGEATRDPAIRDLGIFLYTTEMNAIQEYWFNVHGDTFPPSYSPAIVTMVWGGKGANGTWFTADPQLVHAINWLPIHGGSLYLGGYPQFVEKNYRALVAEHGGDQFNNWPDLIWMYRALTDPADAIRLVEAAGPRFKVEDGNSRANTLHWIYNLRELGQVERGITADHPSFAVFRKGGKRSYVTYGLDAQPRIVTFSDGTNLKTVRGFNLRQLELPAK